ncbi:MAG: dephospho-CoA kinase [Candidatus Promineifilaceae bacterium]
MSKRWPDKVIIGLTGNIATGKSAVMNMAAEKGALTLDADKIVHQILATDKTAQAAVVRQFGTVVLASGGRINRAALAEVVFRDESALQALEQILHPIVGTVVLDRIGGSEANLVMIEAIKLLEGRLAAECDQIWVTRCPEANQIERLRVCRGMDAETAVMRVEAQSSQEEKVAMADVVIDTNGTMADTRLLFNMAWERIVQSLPGPVRPVWETAEAPVVEKPVEPAKAAKAAAPSPDDEPKPKPPPERLSGSKAAEIRKRMLAKKQPASSGGGQSEQAEAESAAEVGRPSGDGIVVRRARPSDVASILLLIKRATDGAVKIKRSELLLALGDRGYLIGQKGTEISTVIGWRSENLIARIDQIFVYPPEAAEVAGPAVLKEIEETAVSLMCEVILAFPSNEIAPPVLELLLDRQFEEVELARLPDVWQAAVVDSQPDDTFILMKKLRDTRILKPV